MTRHSSPDERCLQQVWNGTRKRPRLYYGIRRLRDVLAEFGAEKPTFEKSLFSLSKYLQAGLLAEAEMVPTICRAIIHNSGRFWDVPMQAKSRRV